MSFGQRLRSAFNRFANALADAFLIERAPTEALDTRLSALVGKTLSSHVFQHPVFQKLADIVPLKLTKTAKGNLELSIAKGYGAVEKNSGPFQCGDLRDSLSLGWGYDEISIMLNIISQSHRAIGIYTFSEDGKKTGITIYELLFKDTLNLCKTGHYDLEKRKYTDEPGYEPHNFVSRLIHNSM